MLLSTSHYLILLSLSMAQLLNAVAEKSATGCRNQNSCGACLTAEPSCAWCKTKDYRYNRCDYGAVVGRLCAADDIVSPRSEFSALPPETPPGAASAAAPADLPVQITPQRVRVKLRPHEAYKFDVQFRQIQDYPLDMYYLMDLTYSQWDDKAYLEELGEAMTNTLRELTANFRVGFGSFVDKPVMPYISMLPDDLSNPCRSQGRNCVPAYAFKNHLNFTNDMYAFTQKVRAASVSANIDDPEGGLDALVQAIACQDVIGWNANSRKLIIYSSNGLFHLAGEGLLGGAVKRNDMRCHLNAEGYYTEATTQDYPSVEELASLLRKHSVNVVFAVTSKYKKLYEQLVNVMKASVQVEEITEDSSNILTVIKKQYESITSQLELEDDAPEGITVKYTSSCLGEDRKETNVCTGIKVGDQVTFQIQLEAHGCPKDKRMTVQLRDTRSSESVRVELEVLCECDCERPEAVEAASDQCSQLGDLVCGVCHCPEHRTGRRCECSGDEEVAGCRPEGDSSGPLCSGRGDCVCGECQCWDTGSADRVIDGDFCQCDSYYCDRARDGSICGGKQRGVCSCGECVCEPGWTGHDCTCNNNTRNCMPHTQTEGPVCNGKGDCVCGKCVCYNTEQGRYAGLFCEDCPTCRGLCTTYRPCALCLLRSKQTGHTDCMENCPYLMTFKENLGSQEVGTICRFQDEEDGCFYSFQYYSDTSGNAIVDVLREKECYQVDVLGIVLGTVGGVVAIGLLTLFLWRLYTFLMDRREYAKFEADLVAAKGNNLENINQLYQSPVTTYRVPDGVMKTFNEE